MTLAKSPGIIFGPWNYLRNVELASKIATEKNALHIKAKMQHVSIGDNIVLAFNP
jgi:hypothetical protein